MANDINYNDPKLQQVETQRTDALNDIDETFGGMIGDSDKYYDDLIKGSEDWKNQQIEQQNKQHALTLEQINQQKEQAKKDYTKEQSGAYVDWQKQSGKYGANAEAMADQGMTGTGYSESSQVSMYNAYQNRVATAREAYKRAVLNYDNSINEAMLQNSSILAQIAHDAFVEQTQLALDGLQYKNTLVQNKFNNELAVKQFYSGEYQNVLDQLNRDREYEEGVRQFNEEIARLKAKDANEYELQIKQLEEEKRQFNALHSSSGSGGGTINKYSGGSSYKGGSKGGSTSISRGDSQTTAVNKDDTSSKKSGNSVDMKSVLALGYGPISASRAYELVKQGLAETYTKNGKTYFRRTPYANKQRSLFPELR